jgi:glycosyltransferase involved in cell wall biosynthesis
VVDGETGLLHEVGNVADLSAKIELLLTNKELRNRLGEAGRRHAVQLFQPERLTEALADVLLGRDEAHASRLDGAHHGS